MGLSICPTTGATGSVAGLFGTFSGYEGFFCQPLVLVGAKGTLPRNASGRLLRAPIPPLERFGWFGSEQGEVGFLKCSRSGKEESGAGILPAWTREAGRMPAPLSGYSIKSGGACSRHPARPGAGRRHSLRSQKFPARSLSALPGPVVPGSFESGRPSPRNHKTCLCTHPKQRRTKKFRVTAPGRGVVRSSSQPPR